VRANAGIVLVLLLSAWLGGCSSLRLAYDNADAYARWAGRRLPTEAEWEKAARHDPATGRFFWARAWDENPYTGLRKLIDAMEAAQFLDDHPSDNPNG